LHLSGVVACAEEEAMSNLSATITVTYTMRNICSQQDLDTLGMTLDEIVRDLVSSEGLLGLVEDNYTIESIKENTK
jgi:hypothetical protein